MQKQAPEQIYKLEFGRLNQDAYKIFKVKYLLDSLWKNQNEFFVQPNILHQTKELQALIQ